MMTSKKLLPAAVLTTLVLSTLGLGCGGGGGTPVTETSFCMRKAEAECQVSERCVSDKAACLAERMTLCTQFATAAKAGNERVFTAGNVDACINKTTSVYAKTAPITPQELADMLDLCNYVFQGDGETLKDMCDRQIRLRGQGHLRQGLLRHLDDQGRRPAVQRSGRGVLDRELLHDEPVDAAGLYREGDDRRDVQPDDALPRGAALFGHHVHRPRRRGHAVRQQRRLRDGGAVLRPLRRQPLHAGAFVRGAVAVVR